VTSVQHRCQQHHP